eukprot:TRINITY_DN27991_c0_g1_i1.p2 TRINITY_DN27991_c0_g1~~TRINITY_DN27991_c0_g1_i1.p2  ORF type:complete len:114 (+),score=11.28 TRINITY_DN27991_c0_g1_i1:87-428(+)
MSHGSDKHIHQAAKNQFSKIWMSGTAVPPAIIFGAGCVAILIFSYHQLTKNNTIVVNKSNPRQFMGEKSSEDPHVFSSDTIKDFALFGKTVDRDTGVSKTWHPYKNAWKSKEY